MQASELADGFDPRTQVEVISIAQKNLDSEIFEDILGHGFDGCGSATGMNTGVSTSPWGVSSLPARAVADRDSMWKWMDIYWCSLCDCSNGRVISG